MRGDEHLAAAMNERRARRDAARGEQQGGLLGFLNTAVDTWQGFGARVHHLIRGVDPLRLAEAMQESVEQTWEELRRRLDGIRRQPLFFVVQDLPVVIVRGCWSSAPRTSSGSSSSTSSATSNSLPTSERSISFAPHVDEPQRLDLDRGLAALGDGDPYACRHLLAGVEGACG